MKRPFGIAFGLSLMLVGCGSPNLRFGPANSPPTLGGDFGPCPLERAGEHFVLHWQVVSSRSIKGTIDVGQGDVRMDREVVIIKPVHLEAFELQPSSPKPIDITLLKPEMVSGRTLRVRVTGIFDGRKVEDDGLCQIKL